MSTTSECAVYEVLERLFAKILDDAIEAYHRTPNHISSKPYIERILRLAQSGREIVLEVLHANSPCQDQYRSAMKA